MQTIVNLGLTKAGISSNLYTAVRYGPRSLENIRLFDPLVIQVTGRISFLIKHYWKSTPYRPAIWSNLYNIQLEAGRGGSILGKKITETQ